MVARVGRIDSRASTRASNRACRSGAGSPRVLRWRSRWDARFGPRSNCGWTTSRWPWPRGARRPISSALPSASWIRWRAACDHDRGAVDRYAARSRTNRAATARRRADRDRLRCDAPSCGWRIPHQARECARAAAALGVAELRDVDVTRSRSRQPAPGAAESPRPACHHRERPCARDGHALASGDLDNVGRLFLESHASMRDDFEVSVPPVDALVECAARASGVYGARLTGGGFGGAIVALADRQHAARGRVHCLCANSTPQKAAARA